MAIDNRKVLQNIRVPATKDGPRQTLTEANADDISTNFTQKQLDSFVERGVLEGDWKASKTKASKTKASAGEDEDAESAELMKLTKAELLEKASETGATEDNNKQEIVDKILGN